MRFMIGVVTNIATGRVLEEGKGEDHDLQEEIIDQEAGGIEDLDPEPDLDPDLEVVDIKFYFIFYILFYDYYYYYYHYILLF